MFVMNECLDLDGCADDPNKTDPGVCGCGVPDVDSDNDGSIDCKGQSFLERLFLQVVVL